MDERGGRRVEQMRVIVTTSDAEVDIVRSYDLGANCYVTKPIGLDQFIGVVKAIEDFWFTVVKLPKPEPPAGAMPPRRDLPPGLRPPSGPGTA